MATKINTALTNPNSSKKVDPQKQEPTKDDKKVKNDLPIYAQIANKMNKTKTVQQRLFVGDSALNFKNLEIQKWIGKNEEMLGLIGGEYNKIKKLLLRYKIIKEQLELQYLKKAKERGLSSYIMVSFGDNHGDVIGDPVGTTMDYSGRGMSIDCPSFVVFTEQDR